MVPPGIESRHQNKVIAIGVDIPALNSLKVEELRSITQLSYLDDGRAAPKGLGRCLGPTDFLPK